MTEKIDNVNKDSLEFNYNDFIHFYEKGTGFNSENIYLKNKVRYVKPSIVLLKGTKDSGKNYIIQEFIEEKDLSTREIRQIYYPFEREIKHIFTDLLYSILDITISDVDKDILEKLDNICKNDEKLIRKFTILLELLKIIDTNISFHYSAKEIEKLTLNVFFEFLSFVADRFFEENSKNLVISLYNIENISYQSLKLFFVGLNRSDFKSPIQFFLTFSKDDSIGFDFLNLLESFQDEIVFKMIEISNGNNFRFTKILIENQLKNRDLKNLDSTIDDLINIASGQIITAIELLSLVKNGGNLSNKDLNLDDIYLLKLKSLSDDSLTIVQYLIFFDGMLYYDFIELILSEISKKEVAVALAELYKKNIIVFKSKNLYFSDLRIFEYVSQSFDNYKEIDFIQNNLSTISKILKDRFLYTKRRYLHYLTNFYNKLSKSKVEANYKRLFLKYDYEDNYIEMLRIIKSLSLESISSSKSEQIFYLSEKIITLYNLGQYDLLIDEIDIINIKSKDLLNRAEFYIITNFYLGMVYYQLGIKEDINNTVIDKIDENISEKLLFKAYAMAKEIKEFNWIGKIQESIGDYYKTHKNYEKAKEFYNNSVKMYKLLNYPYKCSVIYYKMSKASYNMNSFDQSLDELNLSTVFYKKLNSKIVYLHFGRMSLHYAKLSFKKNNYIAAEKNFIRSISVFESFLKYDLLSDAYFSLGELYNIIGKMDDASNFIYKSIGLGIKLNSSKNILKLNYFLSKYYLYRYDLKKSRIYAVKGLQFSQKYSDHYNFLSFMELVGDINFKEKRDLVANRCYEYVFKESKRKLLVMKLPNVIFKLAKLYSSVGNYKKSSRLLKRFLKEDFKFYITNDNEFSYNNILIENFINELKFDEAKILIDKQQKMLDKNEFSINKRVEVKLYELSAIYNFTIDQFEKGESEFLKAVELCKSNKLILEELDIHLKISDLLIKLEFKRDALKSLTTILPNARKLKSKYLEDLILEKIYIL